MTKCQKNIIINIENKEEAVQIINEDDIKNWLTEGMDGEVLNDRIKMLENKSSIIDRLIKEVKAEMVADREYCPKCDKYYRKKLYTDSWEKEVTVEITYHDFGYGDDDKLGQVEYAVKYRTCPEGHEREIERKRLRILKEWYRNP